MKVVRAATLVLAAVVWTGCGGDSGGPPPSLTGTWQGSQSGVQIFITLSESGGTVSGTGSIQDISRNVTLSVTGTFAPPAVNLTMTPQGYVPILYTAQISGANTINGELNGSGFNHVSYTLHRL